MASPHPTPADAPHDSLQNLSLPARLEAILYLKGRPVPLAELATIAGIEREEAELALITLMADYAHRDTALEIRQDGQSYAAPAPTTTSASCSLRTSSSGAARATAVPTG
jgi:segregation and condensation protein B